MRVQIHDHALRDIGEIIDWLDDESPSASERFLDELEAARAFVSEHPYSGHPCGPFRRRNLHRFRYHFLYQIVAERNEIWVMVVRHDSRHPSYGAKRQIPESE